MISESGVARRESPHTPRARRSDVIVCEVQGLEVAKRFDGRASRVDYERAGDSRVARPGCCRAKDSKPSHFLTLLILQVYHWRCDQDAVTDPCAEPRTRSIHRAIS